MKIKYIFSKKEKLLIKELSEMNNTYNYSGVHDNFMLKYTQELSEFKENGFLYHSNRGSEGSWIRFSVSEKGLKAFSQAEL